MIGLFKENTKIAIDSIKSQALRTSLTVLIIAIGIWALVGVLTLVTALENSLLTNFASMGANTFSISQYDYSSEINQNDADQRQQHQALQNSATTLSRFGRVHVASNKLKQSNDLNNLATGNTTPLAMSIAHAPSRLRLL